MIHAITITDTAAGESWNTRDDWGLALMTQPVLNMPPVKTHLLDLPGGNGVIDLTEAVRGYPLYGNREGSFEFVAKGTQGQWQTRISQISGALHGQYVRIALDDVPGWHLDGRLSLNVGACVPQYGTVVIDYSLEPYMWADRLTDEPWLWDPFSFIDGVIGNGTYTDPVPITRDIYTVTTDYEDTQLDYSATMAYQPKLLPTFWAEDADAKLEKNPHGGGSGFVTPLANITEGTLTMVDGLTLENGIWMYEGNAIDIWAYTEAGTASLTVNLSAEYNGGDAWSHIEIGPAEEDLDFYPDSEDADPHTGRWPRSAAGAAPVQVTFTATGANVTLKVLYAEDGSTFTTQTLTDGTPATVPGLVLYHGKWLYDGRAARVQAYTNVLGMANLALTFREGRL